MKTTQTKSWLLIRAAMMALFLGVATQVNAWGSLSLPSFDIAPGETKTLAIQFEAGLDYVAFQFDLYLPEGLTIVKQENGKPDLRFHEDRISDHSFSSATQTDGALRVFGISLNNSSFSGTEGDFVYFTVTAADDFDGDHEVLLKKVMFSTAQGQRDELSDNIATATVRHWTFDEATGHLFVNDNYEYVPWGSHKTEIKTVEFGHRVTSIGDYAFDGCSSLTNITIPEGVTSIGYEAFSGCSSLTSITIPEGVTSIGDVAFQNCSSLTSITIPEGVTSIGYAAFSGCSSLTSITIPEGVTSIGIGAFQYCSSLTGITIPEGVTSIGGGAFWGCFSLTSITIPEGVTSIADSTFEGCSSLTSITIPEGVTGIGDEAFYNCSRLGTVINLSDLDIEAGSENHGFVAYYAEKVWTRGVHLDCTERGLLVGDQFTLEATVIPAGPSVTWSSSNESVATVDNGVVTGVGEGTATITASAGNYSATCTVTVSKKEIPVTGIELNQTSATIIIGNTLTLEATVTPGDATDKTVTWSSSNTSVATVDNNGVVTGEGEGTATITATAGSYSATCTVTVSGWTFDAETGHLFVNDDYVDGYIPWESHKTEIKTVEFGHNVTSIGSYAFFECSLTSVTIPEGVTSIGSSAFAYCGLTAITIPEGVTSIAHYTFFGCSSLTSITIPESVTSIGGSAFASCSRLTAITIPEGVTSIENCTFYNCRSLTAITIPDGVTSIGEEAFRDCFAFTNITIPESVTSMGVGAFRGCTDMVSITLPSGLTSIEGNTFYDCYELTNITIPEGVTSIGEGAFNGCSSLTSITIPEGVTSIGQGAFENCSNLKTVINLSDLDIEAGSETHGHVAYYAEKVWTRGVHLDCTERGLLVGDQFTLEATVIPAGPSVTWSSSNESVATVDNGVVTGVGEGTATITASAGNYSATCTVTVSKKEIPVTGIELNQTSATIIIGNTLTLEATVYPGDATDKTVTWSSSNESVATVDNGVVTGEGEGTATITATAGNYSATCTVTVEAAVVEPEPEGLVVGKNYRIKNVSAELYLQASSNNTNMQLHAQGEKLSQIFQLEMAEEGKYYIKVADAENSYYAHASLWNFNATTNADNKTPFTIELVENEEAVYTLHQATSGNPGYVGADATSEGASVYCDKGIGSNGKWTFEAVADDEYIAILRAELGAAIDGANDVVNTRSTILSTEGIDAINTAVALAENKKDNLDDWATLNTLFKEINDAVCGAIYVNDLNELSNNVCYVVSTEDRGSWYSDSDAERLNSTTKLGVPFDATNPKQQFAFVTPDGGNTYYLYSVSEKKFVSEEMTAEEIRYTQLTDAPVQTITFLNGVRSEAFPWVVALNTEVGEKQIAVSNSYAYGVITYNDLGDAGNTVRFEKAAAFDPAEALVHFVTGVELNADAATLTEGESMTLTATILPNTIMGITVEWSTSDESVATVENGVVAAVDPGTATITATAGNYSATCEITVEAAVVEPEPEPELEGIASISELSNDKLYQVAQLKRGNTAWAVAENGEALKSNVDLSIGVDAEDIRQHFAFIKHNDRFYLYHAAEKMFVSKDGSLNVQPVDAINITESTVFDGTFVMYFDDMHYINVDGNGYMAVNDWATHDGGNSCSIIPVGDFDPTEAINAIKTTRIENSKLKIENSELIYDLTGRRVLSTENLKGGIYIVNGKKVVIK